MQKKDNCRLCKSNDLWMFLDLGYSPHSDQFRNNIDEEEIWYPLRLNQCQNCGFVQLSHVVSPETMFQKDYLYESSITTTANGHWKELAETVSKKLYLKPGASVLDIGSNDGTLLEKFKELGFKVQGIDPCKEVAEIANSKEIPTIVDFFPSKELTETYSLITACNVFAHVDDVDNFVLNVRKHLNLNGTLVIEAPYFGDLIKGLEYDTIYHQHLSYESLKPLQKFFESYGFDIWDVERYELHGGGFRLYISRAVDFTPRSQAVDDMLESEDFSKEKLSLFATMVEIHREVLFNMILNWKKDNKKIVAVSAPAKGQTLLNYTGIGRFLDYATEKSNLKIGRYTPGTHLKIYSDAKLIEDQPDYALILAWNFAPEIMKNNKDFKGKWIIPLPEIVIK